MIHQKIGQEWMIYNPQDGQTHILNITAGMIYEWTLQGQTPDQIEILLQQQFQITDLQNLQADIQECLTQLRQKNLIP